MADQPLFDGAAIVGVLARHGVECIVIGGFAAVAQGSPIPTIDVDVVPATGRDNYVRLSAALQELDAKVRAHGTDPLPFRHDADSLAVVNTWNLTTKYGDLDITVMPSGTQGYDDLVKDSIEVTIAGNVVRLASLADVVRSKEAAGRDKDRRALPVLRELVARELKSRRPGSGRSKA